MGFYNKGGPVQIVTFEDVAGETHPLDVLPVGGGSLASSQITNPGSSLTILGAPNAGMVWRLHHFSSWNWPNVAAGVFPYIVVFVNPSGVNAFSVNPYAPFLPLNGLITGSSVAVTIPSVAATIGFTLAYSQIALPVQF